MSAVLEFLPEAKCDAEEATRFYERRVPGLGARFRAEVKSVCAAGDASLAAESACLGPRDSSPGAEVHHLRREKRLASKNVTKTSLQESGDAKGSVAVVAAPHSIQKLPDGWPLWSAIAAILAAAGGWLFPRPEGKKG